MGAEITLNNAFRSAFDCQKRYIVLMGGAGSGKSWFACDKILIRCISEFNNRFLIVRKTFPSLRRSVWTMFIERIKSYNIPAEVNISERRIKIGSNELLFVNLDDPQKLTSIERVTSVFIEEATELEENDFDQLDLRLRGESENYKQIILAFNPVSAFSWLKRRFFDQIDQEALVLITTYRDNPFLDAEYRAVLESKQSKNPLYWKIYGLAEWGQLEGVIYTNWTVVESMPEGDEYYGLDFGYNNPTAMVRVVEKDGEIYTEEILFRAGMTNIDLIEWLKENIPTGSTIYCDTAEPARIEEIYMAGFNAKPSIKDVKNGIMHMISKKIHITAASKTLIAEISEYTWEKDKDGRPTEKPIKKDDHLLDALRYAVYTRTMDGVFIGFI